MNWSIVWSNIHREPPPRPPNPLKEMCVKPTRGLAPEVPLFAVWLPACFSGRRRAKDTHAFTLQLNMQPNMLHIAIEGDSARSSVFTPPGLHGVLCYRVDERSLARSLATFVWHPLIDATPAHVRPRPPPGPQRLAPRLPTPCLSTRCLPTRRLPACLPSAA